MRIADKYKVDTIAALTRCNREVIREILVKMFTNCLKLTLVSDDSASLERLLEQKKSRFSIATWSGHRNGMSRSFRRVRDD